VGICKDVKKTADLIAVTGQAWQDTPALSGQACCLWYGHIL